MQRAAPFPPQIPQNSVTTSFAILRGNWLEHCVKSCLLHALKFRQRMQEREVIKLNLFHQTYLKNMAGAVLAEITSLTPSVHLPESSWVREVDRGALEPHEQDKRRTRTLPLCRRVYVHEMGSEMRKCMTAACRRGSRVRDASVQQRDGHK